jgi:superoxide dismutase, Fe-Mn family
MSLTQTPLPFDHRALEPYMSGFTVDYHYGKHHKSYVDYTAAAIKGSALENASLEQIVRASRASHDVRLFNNSAQAWNHDFFWKSITPSAPRRPTGTLAKWLTSAFGSIEEFKGAFKNEAVAHFGSGWAWLVLEDDNLHVRSYHDADTPLVHEGVEPILTADLWEHAYYLDYQNARGTFLDAFLENVVDWEGANGRLERAIHRNRHVALENVTL